MVIQSISYQGLEFVEYPRFTSVLTSKVSDEDFRKFQMELVEDPERGALIQGTGGFRKARMRLQGGGKSGGARVIYLYIPEKRVVFLANVYKKSARESLTSDEKNFLGKLAQDLKRYYRLG